MKTLKERYEALDDQMKMYFRQETTIRAWDKIADDKNAQAKMFNASKKWWQRKKSEDFPHYHETPIQMPIFFPIPPTWDKNYKKTKKLIEDYCEGV